MKRKQDKITYNIDNIEQSKEHKDLLPDNEGSELNVKSRRKKKLVYRKKISLRNLLLLIVTTYGFLLLTNYAHENVTFGKEVQMTRNSDDIANITFLGDVMMGRSSEFLGAKNGYDYFFNNSQYLWEDSDIVVANLESAIINDSTKFKENKDKEIHLRSKSASLDAMDDAGVTIYNLANNHVGDYRRSGMKNTLKHLDKRNMDYIGAGYDKEDAMSYVMSEINGETVAFVSVSDIVPRKFTAGENKPGILTTNDDNYLRLIKHVSGLSDKTVIYVHWGEEIPQNITQRQQELGQGMIDNGADVVVGMHPHVIQQTEKYKDGIILYSLGNFIFDQEQTRTKDSIVTNFRIDKNGKSTLEFIPMRIVNGRPRVTHNPFFKRRIYKQLLKNTNADEIVKKGDTLILKGI